MSDERYVVFDNKGIITETPDEDEAMESFEHEDDFIGDLILAKIIARRA